MRNGNLCSYSGLTTKIRAMKSRLLLPEQYDEISQFSKVSELINYLQNIPSYQTVFANLDPANIHRGEVESRLSFSTYNDFSKIFHFAGKVQKKYLQFYFMKYEVAILKACMRNIMDSRTEIAPILTDAHFEKHTRIDMNQLINSNTIEDFINVLTGSIYEKPFKKVLRLENPTLFDYEINLDLYFFTYVWKKQDNFITKNESSRFQSFFGAQIDLLNILWIYRCKNFYNLIPSQILSFLIPVYYNIKSSDINAFISADNNDAFFELLNNSYYGKRFNFDYTKELEPQFANVVTHISLVNFQNEPYSISSINAYFRLKDLEVSRVVTALESIRYGYKPEDISYNIYQRGGIL